MTPKIPNRLFGTDKRIVALAIARMADAFGNSFLIVIIPLYIASEYVHSSVIDLSVSLVTGLILGLFGLITSFVQPFAGYLSDRYGKRTLFVIIGLVLFSIANFSFSFAHNYLTLFLVRALQGFSAALTVTASIALVSEFSTPYNRGNNMGVYNSFRLIGFGTGPLVSGLVIEAGDYNLPLIGETNGFIVAFLIAGTTALISTVLVVLFVKDPPDIVPTKHQLSIQIRDKFKKQYFDPIFALGMATFIMSFGFALLAPIETETNARLDQGPFMFAIEFSAMIATMAVIQPIVGKASDRYGRKIFILTGLVLLVPTTIAQGLSVEPWQLITSRAFQGFSAAMIFAPALALAGDLSEKGHAGSQLSVLTMAFGLGVSIGSFTSGYTIRFGYVVPFIIGACMALVGVFIVRSQVPSLEND